jgi:uncharacterized protein
MKRVLVSGGTGFIGARLVRALIERGDRPSVLGRDAVCVRELFANRATPIEWTPEARGAWMDAVADHDAVVHLAGEQAVGVRWTESTKRRIHDSRVVSTELIVEAIWQAPEKPAVFACASAVGYYGARAASEALDESSAPGDDFLARVCRDWEAAARAAEPDGVRVVRARLGVVIGKGGGALEAMAAPFRIFAGGPIAGGAQAVSWVHADDVVGALLFAIDDARVTGPVNVVAPESATNAELARAIGKALGRPAWLNVPAFALRARFGEGAEPLVTGQRARPARLHELGFHWRYPTLGAALAEAL